MNSKILSIAFMLSGFFLKIFLTNVMFCSLVLANSGNGQNNKASVKDIFIKIDLSNASILEVFKQIEERSNFKFNYEETTLDQSSRFTFNVRKRSIASILQSIGRESGLKFRRINNVIDVSLSDRSTKQVIDEVMLEVTVTGAITDENGEPLPGATVLEKGTTNGTITDVNGKYSINVKDGNAILVISFLGYRVEEASVAGRSVVDVVMFRDITALQEIVVVGYGTQKKVNLTGSVASLDTDNVNDIPVPNTLNRLQGQLAGVQLTLPGGQPGEDQPIVRVRGATSINNDPDGDPNNTNKNNPLVIIDGIQSTLQDLARLNPNVIENLSVLKDAASSAIYGARAANGVILVTTKTGATGKPTVNFGINTGMQEAIVLPEFVGAVDYAILKNEARANRGEDPIFSDEDIQILRDQNDPRVANTFWMDELFDTAPMTQYDVSISGGSENIRYLFSGGRVDQEGIMLNQSAERTNFRSNLNAKLTDRISLGMNVWGFRNVAKRGFQTTSETLRRAYFSSALVPPRWTEGPAEGELAGESPFGFPVNGVQNPLLYALGGHNITTNDKFSIQLNPKIEITKNLSFSGVYGYSVNNNEVDAYRPILQLRTFDGQIATRGTRNYDQTLARRSLSRDDQYQVDNLLNYSNTWGNHTLGVLVGHSVLNFENTFFLASAEGLAGNIQQVDAGTLNPVAEGRASDWALQSFFGRVSYNFNEKYLFEANFRADGSSRFAESRRYGYFPSFSGAWRISEEDFLKDNPLIANLKLRASWGILGNQEIGNYPSQQAFNIEEFYVDADGNLVTGAAITDLANNVLQWEETTTTNFGLDFTLWEGKLDMSVDYFEKVTDGILVRLPLPPTLGQVNSPFQNAAVVENRGWEFTARYRENIGEFSFSFAGNFNILKNEVTDFNDQQAINGTFVIKEGEQINAFFGFENTGIFQEEDEVTNSPFQSTTTAPGDLIYADTDLDGEITPDDRVVIGNSIPRFSYGFNLDFGYKGFDMGLFFQGVGDVEGYSRGFGNDAVSNPRANPIDDWLNRWTPENPSTEFPRIVRADRNNSQVSSYWLRDASFLRLRNIQVGYTFPELPAFESIGLTSLRIYFSGQNLLTFSNTTQWDPEVFPSETESRQHPQTKVISFGLNASF